MNLIKTGQLPIVEFLKYVEDGQEHLAEVIDRKKSNCTRRVSWVSGTSPRHSKYLPRASQPQTQEAVEFQNIVINDETRIFNAEFAREDEASRNDASELQDTVAEQDCERKPVTTEPSPIKARPF